MAIFDNALRLCHQIEQVHPSLLGNLKFPRNVYMSSVGLLADEVCEIRYRLKTAYRRSIIPLHAYAKQLDKFLELFCLDVAKYIG